MSPAKENSIEVTAEDAAAFAGQSSFSPTSASSGYHNNKTAISNTTKSVAKKFSKLMSKNLSIRSHKSSSSSSPNHRHHNRSSSDAAVVGDDRSTNPLLGADGDNSSVNGEVSVGQMSVAQTVTSIDTVKISNRNALAISAAAVAAAQQQAEGDDGHSKGKKTTWKKLKNFMSNNQRKVDSRTDSDDGHSDMVPYGGPIGLRRTHAKSADYPSGDHEATSSSSSVAGTISSLIGNRRRTASTDTPKTNQRALQEQHRREKAILDDAVRGRLDGTDLLYLGPAYQISLERQQHSRNVAAAESSTPWEPASTFSFAGRSTQYSTRQMVDDMMWRPTTGDQRATEIVLEGFYRDDRWIVTLDVPRSTFSRSGSSSDAKKSAVDHHAKNTLDSVPLMQLTDEEEQSHSTSPTADEVPRHKLWNNMWGAENKPPPKPSHMSSVEDIDESDSILEMAASCSVPIDLDEDTFMISNAGHLESVHDLAAVPLQHGRFEESMFIFRKILKGVRIQETDSLRHLEGVTLHNMAVILMWQHKYEEALDYVGKAIKARLQYLPENHPDIAVSLSRQGVCYFALEQYGMAVASFQAAVDIFKPKSVAKAKALLNLGVANYQSGDDVEALDNFNEALNIQRMWLEGPVKREANVFGAAVMLGNMGKVYIKRGDYDLAISVYEEALLLLTSIFPKDNEMVLGSRASLALAWAFNDQPQKAIKILNSVFRCQVERFGPGTVEVIETTGVIGNLHFGLGNYEDALKCFTPVLKWQKAHLRGNHPSYEKTKVFMKKIKNTIKTVWV